MSPSLEVWTFHRTRFLIIVFAVWAMFGTFAYASEVTVFGPKQYLRESAKPSLMVDAFSARNGAAMLEVNNGALDGGSRVSSATIALNGRQILGPSDFNQQRYHFQIPVQLDDQNVIRVELRSKPGTYVSLLITQEAVFTTPFAEEVPAWNQPDLAVKSLTIDPDRCDPGQAVTLRAVVSNLGTAAAASAQIAFRIDGTEIARLPIPALGAGLEHEAATQWTAQGSGRRIVSAYLMLQPGNLDRSADNNQKDAIVRVSGAPLSEVEYTIKTDPGPPVPNQPAVFTVQVRNPGFTALSSLHVRLFVNDLKLANVITVGPQSNAIRDAASTRVRAIKRPAEIAPPDMIGDAIIPILDPGTFTTITFAWPDPLPGEYVTKVKAFSADQDTEIIGSQFAAFLVLPDTTTLYDGSLPDQWTSMGPTIVTQTKSGGRIDSLAVYPTVLPRLYAASPFTGVWRSNDGGSTWQPKGDKLSHTVIAAVAVDPGNPDIVYCAAANWGRAVNIIYKSIDGGTKWYFFSGINGSARKLVVRRTTTGAVVIYAATDNGILRYSTQDPLSLVATSNWYTSLSGDISDMVVHPTNNNVLYAVRNVADTRITLDGHPVGINRPRDIRRTAHGLDGTAGSADWTDVSPFPFDSQLDSVTIDLCRTNPAILYAGIKHAPTQANKGNGYLLVFASNNEGAAGTWQSQFQDSDNGGDIIYNPYIRVHPQYPSVVYYGGVKLRMSLHVAGFQVNMTIPDVHDDQRDLVFMPDGKSFYALTDGGIWLGTFASTTGFNFMTSLNYNLRSHMFFEMDVSQSDPNIMIGGLQDNGTLRYQTTLDWKEIRGGDGLYALIAPSNNQVMYSQHQFLHDTRKSPNGGQYWVNYGNNEIVGLQETANSGDPNTKFIAVDPVWPDHIMAQGNVVQDSTDGGRTWQPDSYFNFPMNGTVRGAVTQFQFFDVNSYLAGTSDGQVWFRKTSSGGGIWAISDVPGTHIKRMARSPNEPKLHFAVSTGLPDERIKRFSYDSLFDRWTMQNMTADLPEKHLITNADLIINTIAADPCGSADVAYVGTDKGVFRGALTLSGFFKWRPYNVGLPLVNVMKLVPVMQTQELRAATYGRGVWTVKPTCSY